MNNGVVEASASGEVASSCVHAHKPTHAVLAMTLGCGNIVENRFTLNSSRFTTNKQINK